MTFLLVVYMFMQDGTVITNRYDHAATSIEDCVSLGREKQKELWQQHPHQGDTAMMCILEKQA